TVFCCERDSRSFGQSQCLECKHTVTNNVLNAISLTTRFRGKSIQSLIGDLTVSSHACENTVDKAGKLAVVLKLQVADVTVLLLDQRCAPFGSQYLQILLASLSAVNRKRFDGAVGIRVA